MPRNLVIKIIFVFTLILLSVYSLYPTMKLDRLHREETNLIAELSKWSNLSLTEIDAALVQGNLEAEVSNTVKNDSLSKSLALAEKLNRLSGEISKIENRAIRQGLDLQGGTYLVYEADIPQLLNDLAKNKDDRFNDIIATTRQAVDEQGGDFFDVLMENFRSRDIRLNRYFGRKGQADDEIINEIKKEAEDAVDRTLEVLRNRIDQFGVSEPSIQKQGTRRIVIELAGIQNIQRAKSVIGTTALLEFKLVKDPQIVWAVLEDIDRVMRTVRKGEEFQTEKQVDASEPDTTKASDGATAEDKQVSLNELFGESTQQTTAAGEDTTLLVDQKTFSERPFTSLLRQVPGRSVITVPRQNMLAVQRILQLPEAKSVIPQDSEFLWGKDPIISNQTELYELHLVKSEPELVGSMLTDARVNIGGGDASLSAGAAEVQMELNNEGTKTFARVTGMNVGKQLAIVLDKKVASYPNIKEKIPSGSARIDGIGSMDEAKDLALVLRAGALPAPVHSITENTVGPSLGLDSIQKGQKAAMLGLALVVIFMIFYYRGSGVIADMALFLNVIFVLAVMASFHATLTLPGIAGIVLTMGMAVDANVLIFERIREELRSGKTVRAAIDAGYARALITILDANITTLITAVVLYSFGTGPIRGFALTLSIGIIVSMFTAIFVTRIVFDMLTTRFAITKLSI